jgi:SAM-dependent methyltransferase
MNVHSVVDVGCGTGGWLAAFADRGVTDYQGFDGPWVPVDRLEIPRERFTPIDFTRLGDIPTNRRFDLVVSLEVAEHLPSETAEDFVDLLTKLGPAILFSGAVPLQGGVGHENEQWLSYWIGAFERRGYICLDAVRGAFWDDPTVALWYSQNTFVFLAPAVLSKYAEMVHASATNTLAGKALIHPQLYMTKISELSDPRSYSLRKLAGVFPELAIRSLKRLLSR